MSTTYVNFQSNLCSDTATPHREDNGLNETSIFEWLGPKWLEGRRYNIMRNTVMNFETYFNAQCNETQLTSMTYTPITQSVRAAASLNFRPMVHAATATA